MDYIEKVEQIREELIQMVNWKCDAMLQMYQNGSQIACSENRVMESKLAWIAPTTLKGKKPIGLKFASGVSVKTPTWKSVVQTIMQHCNSQPDMHERLMKLSGKVAGRQRIILGKSAEEMDVPIKIDEGLYFEGKFDTEALLTMMTKKVLEPIGYDYSQIIIQYTDRVSMMSESNLIMSNEDVPDIEEMGQTQSMMRGM
jgi:hypothetical protein